MASSGAAPRATVFTSKRSALADSLSVGLYLALSAFIFFLYFRAIFQLFPFRERILGGVQWLLPTAMPQLSPLTVLLVIALLALALIFMPQLARAVSSVPAGIRGLLATIPLYLLLGRDARLAAVLVAIGAVGWIFYKPLGRVLSRWLARLPAVVAAPIARFWSAILLTALLTQAVLPTIGAIGVMLAYHYADQLMEWLFRPVWTWHRSLPKRAFIALYAARLAIAGSASILLSYSFAWFNWDFGNMVFVYGIAVAAICYFVGRVPAPKTPAPR